MKKRKSRKEPPKPKLFNTFYASIIVAILCAITVAAAFHRLKVRFIKRLVVLI